MVPQWFPALHAEAVTHTLAALDVSSIAGEGSRWHRHWERVTADSFLSQGPKSRRRLRRNDFLVDSPSNLGTLAKAVNLPDIWF